LPEKPESSFSATATEGAAITVKATRDASIARLNPGHSFSALDEPERRIPLITIITVQ
jgi:hypothetical protein